MPRTTQYHQLALEQAIHAVQNGTSIRNAASNWAVPRATLYGRINGRRSADKAHLLRQRLSPCQEADLAEWIRCQDALALPPTHSQVRSLVIRILRTNGDHRPLGKKWIPKFLARNEPAKTLRAIPLDSARANGVTSEAINKLFDRIEGERIQQIHHSNRWNIDEVGLLQGVGCNGLVLGQSEKKKTLIKQDGSREWTSILECISADGKSLNPLIIFKGKKVQEQWFEKELAHLGGWRFTASENGWTDDKIAVNWLTEIFIPATAPADPTERRLLILDGHGSHETEEFMWAAYQARITLLYLPPHTTHVTQPLDVGIFSLVKRYYRAFLQNEPISTHYSCPIGKAGFLRLYHKARVLGITPDTISSAWLGAGLWPIDREKILQSHFMVQQAANQPSDDQSNQPFRNTPRSDWLATPRKSRDLAEAYQKIVEIQADEPIKQRIFEKAGKAIDQLISRLATAEAENANLKQLVERAKPRRRRQVKMDPNDVFVEIRHVRETRLEINRRLNPSRSSVQASLVGFEELCSEWQMDVF